MSSFILNFFCFCGIFDPHPARLGGGRFPPQGVQPPGFHPVREPARRKKVCEISSYNLTIKK
nr:MAG TPA: Superoxide dismutase [Caudoviricetes sp.]